MEYAMTEAGQDETRIAFWVEMFTECPDDVPAIVVCDGAIIDGHHRYLAAQTLGITPAVSALTAAQRDAIVAETAGDVMALAATAHYLSGNYTAIDWIAQQFPGADVEGEAARLAEMVG